MKIEHLELFLRIVETGSFSKAADTLFISQSSLSKQIMKFEKDLGVVLFNREKRTISLTSRGKILYKQAPILLEKYYDLLNLLKPNSDILRLGTLPIMAHYGFTNILYEFTKSYPNVDIEIEEASNMQLSKGLEEDLYDLAFMRVLKSDTKFDKLVLCEDELVIVVSSSHEQASKNTVSLKSFKNEKFLVLGKDTMLYESTVQSCRKAGFSPDILFTGSSSKSIIELVQSGVAVAIFMNQIAQDLQQNSHFSILKFKETVKSELVLAKLKNTELGYQQKLFWDVIYKNFLKTKYKNQDKD